MRILIPCFFLIMISIKALSAAVPGQYIVKLKKRSALQAMEFNNKALFSAPPEVISTTGKLVLVKSEAINFQAAFDSSEVEYMEPNFIYELDSLPNDPRLKKQWGIINKKNTDVNVAKVWEQLTGSPDVIVAITDTGINSSHPDLKENMWVNRAEKNGQPGVDDDGNGYVDDIYGYHFIYTNNSAIDKNGHGTHCAGIVGASGNNGEGVVGVNWKANLMNAGFLSGRGSGSTADAIKAIDYAVQNGARVISASWGSTEYSIALGEAIARANAAGVVFVAAAGNSKQDNDRKKHYPSNYDLPNVISVLATTRTGRRASFSNFGDQKVHIGAPGMNIYSTYGNSYASLSGTSMATPFVSGIVALMIQKNPRLTPAEIKAKIIRTAKPVKALVKKVVAGGIIDAEAAVFAP